MDNVTFTTTPGKDLREAREAAGVSQDAIAAKLDTTRQALRRWEQHPALPFVKAQRYRSALAAAVSDAVRS